MLIFTPTMECFLALVVITIFSIQCHAITVRDDDDSIYEDVAKRYEYSDSDVEKPGEEYRQEEYYKPLRRADVRNYQYSEESEYTQPQPDQGTENYPFPQTGQRLPITRRRTLTKIPYVEQYLKEVTPTTKTTYSQRPANYLRLNGQVNQKAVKEQDIVKQPTVQYVLQSDLQQKPQPLQRLQYVIPEQKPDQFHQKEQPPQSPALTAFQNAILAHQKVLETEGQDETSKSSIYVTHSIPKKPVKKIVKPTSTDEDVEQYRQFQQYIQQKQPNVYEKQEPFSYQAKFQYANEDASYQASTEAPNYNREKELQQIRQQIQELAQYQQVPTRQPLLYQAEKLIQGQQQQLTAYQQLLSSRPGKIPRPVNVTPATNYQSSELSLAYKTPSKTPELVPTQYQQPIYLKKGPKYLPEPKSVRYQPSTSDEREDRFKQIVNVPGQQPEPLITYEAALAKLQEEKLLKVRQQRLRPQATYPQQEQSAQTVGFSLQYPSEKQEENGSDTEYVKIGQANKYRASAGPPTISYRQPQESDNVRYYRNSGRPAIPYSHYQ